MPGSITSEDDGHTIMEIDTIQNHGIGASDIAKLKSAKLYTIGLVAMCSRRKLLDIKGFSEIKVEKIKEAIAKCQVSDLHSPLRSI
jgi:meiotic recombination protein DMC1